MRGTRRPNVPPKWLGPWTIILCSMSSMWSFSGASCWIFSYFFLAIITLNLFLVWFVGRPFSISPSFSVHIYSLLWCSRSSGGALNWAPMKPSRNFFGQLYAWSFFPLSIFSIISPILWWWGVGGYLESISFGVIETGRALYIFPTMSSLFSFYAFLPIS